MSVPSDPPCTRCYLSTPAHLRSFAGRFLYVYTDKGELTLSGDTLRFEAQSGESTEIGLNSITEIRMSHYPRIAKPFRLNFVSVAFESGSETRTLLFTPTASWISSVRSTNRVVREWWDLLLATWRRDASDPPAMSGGESGGKEA